MAITDTSTGRVIRGTTPDDFGGHAFASVHDLPRVASGRPGQTGNRALDAIRAEAWDEGYATGHAAGASDGHAVGFEHGLAEARERGYAEGLATAKADAMAEIEARIGSSIEALERAGSDLEQRDAVTLNELEDVVADLALSVAAAILQREIATSTDPGRDALRRALSLAPERESMIARLNPTDLEAIGDVAEMAPGRTLELFADPSIERGGCVIEAGAARIDARIETALDRVREALAP